MAVPIDISTRSPTPDCSTQRSFGSKPQSILESKSDARRDGMRLPYDVDVNKMSGMTTTGIAELAVCHSTQVVALCASLHAKAHLWGEEQVKLARLKEAVKTKDAVLAEKDKALHEK